MSTGTEVFLIHSECYLVKQPNISYQATVNKMFSNILRMEQKNCQCANLKYYGPQHCSGHIHKHIDVFFSVRAFNEGIVQFVKPIRKEGVKTKKQTEPDTNGK